jgi:hypothetical protein
MASPLGRLFPVFHLAFKRSEFAGPQATDTFATHGNLKPSIFRSRYERMRPSFSLLDGIVISVGKK